ncbi:hypothetical protein [Jatrophihabitans sp.]|uniref:hypothetical protein n=1 Tax=Jatrophihabitans sp. TaxID=1932789 RepID=UPI002D1472AB|nr:hypothetical protein [Jatrophihabitans sp.]
MTTHLVRPAAQRLPSVRRRRPRIRLDRRVVGSFFLFTGGVHVGIVAAEPGFYRHFADGALLGFARSRWQDVFMAHPAVWGLVLAAAEVVLGLALLRGGGWARLGWAGVIAFHLALMVFGWGFWLWSVPALTLLIPAARHDLRGSAPLTRPSNPT